MSLFPSMDSLDNEEEPRSMPVFNTIEYSIKTLIERIKSNTITDKEIQGIIYRNHSGFLNYDIFKKNDDSRIDAQELFTNCRFLNNLIVCAPNMELSEHQIICCNKLCFDYIAIHSADDCNTEVRDLLFELCYRVNFKLVMPLTAIVGIEPAKYIVMLRKSSFDEELNISRLNRYLIKSGLELREQNILDIYTKLFYSISNLFATTMLELPESDYTRLESFRYDEMSKVMIDILDSLTSADMTSVLRNYSVVYSLKGEPPVRFSLQNLHESYTRIKKVLYELDLEGIIIP